MKNYYEILEVNKKASREIIDKAYKTALYILQENMDKLNRVASVLLEKEKIDSEEFDAIFEEKAE